VEFWGDAVFHWFWMPIFRGRTQRRSPFAAFGNSKVKENPKELPGLLCGAKWIHAEGKGREGIGESYQEWKEGGET
jgi:hypothetical protein